MKKADEIIIQYANRVYEHQANEAAFYCTCADFQMSDCVDMLNEYAEQFKPKWISVEERLPDGQEEVLVYMPGYGAPIAVYFLTDLDENRLTWLNPFFITKNFNEVTHWMPLPQLPTI